MISNDIPSRFRAKLRVPYLGALTISQPAQEFPNLANDSRVVRTCRRERNADSEARCTIIAKTSIPITVLFRHLRQAHENSAESP